MPNSYGRGAAIAASCCLFLLGYFVKISFNTAKLKMPRTRNVKTITTIISGRDGGIEARVKTEAQTNQEHRSNHAEIQ